jgi:hypothetical protein
LTHLVRAISDAKLHRGYVTVGADLRAIDQNTFVAVNGDAGGTWTPASDLNINGAGVVFAAPCAVSGAQMTVYAPTFGKGTADDVFGLAATHPGRTQTLVQGLVECYSSQPEWVTYIHGGASSSLSALQTHAPGVRWLTPLRIFNGATLETVTLRFYISAFRTVLPTTLAQMRIVAIDANGVVLPMGAGTLYDVGGFHAISSAATADAWSNGGFVQTFVYTCSQNNVIDIGKYTYWLEIIEESDPPGTVGGGALGGNTYVSATSYLDRITLFDGRN